jgi:hypothetical protein
MAGINVVLDKIQRDLAKYGWSAISVFPTEENPGDRFTYTVGLDPELIVVGIHADAAHSVLSRAADLIKDGEKFEPGTEREDVLHEYPVALRPVADHFRRDYMRAAEVLRGEDFQAVQLVWPDKEGRFPWDDEYEYPADAQTLLAVEG